jgi:hypothetical protein
MSPPTAASACRERPTTTGLHCSVWLTRSATRRRARTCTRSRRRSSMARPTRWSACWRSTPRRPRWRSRSRI